MKIPRLLVLGVLASSLCMVGSAFGQAGCTSELSDSAFPNGGDFSLGDTINYVLCIGVPASNGTTYCTLTNVDVYFYPPGQEPSGANACDDPNSDPNAVFIDHLDQLAPGDTFCYDGNDNSALDYLIEQTVCDANGTVIAFMAVTFELEGAPDCDRKTIVNTVLPVDAPPCGIVGPDEVCEGSEGELYCSEFEADSYLWAVAGGAEIVGPNDANCVLVDPNGSGDYTVYLLVCNDNGDGGCCSDCNLPVTVIQAPDCLINGPDSICESDSAVEFCSDVNDADLYYWEIISGDAVIVGDNDLPCVLVDPNGPNDFTLKLSICFLDPNCCDSCTKTVDVIPTPDCRIDGPSSVCEDSNNVYCSAAEADSYLWEITGDGVIVGPNDVNCVTVSVGAEGSFTLTLTLCNIADTNDCCNTCEKTVAVEPCGQTFCSFTQGAWGNAGGKACGGMETPELITALLDLGGPVIVGELGVRSITFDSNECIILRLPAGGKPSALPASLGDANCDVLPASLVKKNDPRINNVLVGQVVTLTLNVRLGALPCLDPNDSDGLLGTLVLPDEPFCTVPYDDPNGCAKTVEIPEDLQGLTVAELLDAANAALAGDDTYDIGDIYDAVTAINEGFDECRTIVPCIRPEICGNGCDDDGDGLVDGDDPDCAI